MNLFLALAGSLFVFSAQSVVASDALVPTLTTAQINQIVLARRQVSDSARYLSTEKMNRHTWSKQSYATLSISVGPSECHGRKECPLQWLLSGTIGGLEATSEIWQQALVMANGVSPRTVVLDSIGGDAEAALWLSAKIQSHKINTRVEDWGVCLSACVYLLSAGKERSIAPWSIIGVHGQNASDGVTEGAFRDDAIRNTMVAQSISGQANGVGDNLMIPLHLVIKVVDNVSSHIQRRTGEQLLIMERSGISPLLLSYTVNTKNTRGNQNVRILALPCLRALALDNQEGRRRQDTLKGILAVCGPLDD